MTAITNMYQPPKTTRPLRKSMPIGAYVLVGDEKPVPSDSRPHLASGDEHTSHEEQQQREQEREREQEQSNRT